MRGAQCYVLIQAWLSFFLRYAPEEAKALLSGFIADSKNLPKLEYAEGRVGGCYAHRIPPSTPTNNFPLPASTENVAKLSTAPSENTN